MEPYNTQQESIANKARSRGISPSLVSTYFHNRLSNIYNTDPQCEELWALGKAEYEVWKKFFPSEPFPIKEMNADLNTANEVKQEPGLVHGARQASQRPQQLGKAQSPIKLEPGEIAAEIGKKQWRRMQEMNDVNRVLGAVARETGHDNNTMQGYYAEKLGFIRERYPREGLRWQQWMAGKSVWETKLDQKKPFPVKEPSRSYALLSSGTVPEFLDPTRGEPQRGLRLNEREARYGDRGREWIRYGPDFRSRSTSPNRHSGDRNMLRRRSKDRHADMHRNRSKERSRNSGSTVHGSSPIVPKLVGAFAKALPTGDLPAVRTGYRTNERVMEAEAIKLDIRREFFVCLQKNRDFVRFKHPHCDGYRGWLADRLTWEAMFKGRRFPWLAEEPIMAHSSGCPDFKRNMQPSQNLHAVSMQPKCNNISNRGSAVLAPTGPRALTENKPTVLLSNHISMPIRNHSMSNQITMERKQAYHQTAMKENRPLNHAPTKQPAPGVNNQGAARIMVFVNKKQIPCPGKFGSLCEYFLREIQSDTRAQQELKCNLGFGTKMDTIHLSSSLGDGSPTQLSAKDQAIIDKADTFLEAWVSNLMVSSVSSVHLSQFWDIYKTRLASTVENSMDIDMDVDAMLKEEAAKVEGASRKVFDEVTGKVVPLKEYEIMIKTRILNAAHGSVARTENEKWNGNGNGNAGVLKDVSNFNAGK